MIKKCQNKKIEDFTRECNRSSRENQYTHDITRENSFLAIKKLAFLFWLLKKLNFSFDHLFYFTFYFDHFR
jgi:hypothetical protein